MEQTARFRQPISRAALAAALCIVGFVPVAHGQARSPLAPEPDWAALDAYQETVDRATFGRLLAEVYAPGAAAEGWITVGESSATIRTGNPAQPAYELRFAPAGGGKSGPNYWRAYPVLKGARIALDPGHIGGRWARMEERWFRIGDGKPVTEGDLVLVVARRIEKGLKAKGAEVSWVRSRAEPVTPLRPKDLRKPAAAELAKTGARIRRETYDGPGDAAKGNSVQWHSEILFYRHAEIRARAKRVNEVLKPDLVLCIHFNAEAWGDPAQPTFTDKNHLHLLVNGCYSARELALDDVRLDMLRKLLSGAFGPEAAYSEKVAGALAAATGLPPYEYPGTNAKRLPGSRYVWARNLLANRLYRCPVVFLEPYVMNSKEVYDRIQAGDYEGVREVGGRPVRSIFREYADAVVEGLARALER